MPIYFKLMKFTINWFLCSWLHHGQTCIDVYRALFTVKINKFGLGPLAFPDSEFDSWNLRI